MFRKSLLTLLALTALLLAQNVAAAEPKTENYRFGILREISGGGYRMDVETTRIPRRLKDSGFRFGVSFENPSSQRIEWYEIVHLPAELREASGNLRRIEPKTLKTNAQKSDQRTVVDDFWFDEGDPLGKHRMDLYVNGLRVFSVDFEVVDR